MPTRMKSLSSPAAKKEFLRLDEMIRAGKATQARGEIVALSAKRLPRESIMEIASLVRRAEIPDTAIRMLSPLVLPSRALAKPATSSEIAEYAASLVKIGATTEALSHLSKLHAADCPSALLYTAFAHVAVWDYQAAVPLFQSYLEHPLSDPYLKFVARVNLASSFTYERRHDEAIPLVDTLLGEAKALGFTLLTGG